MKRIHLSFSLYLLTCIFNFYTASAQIGLLSTNNKTAKNSGQNDTMNYPRLYVTKETGRTSYASDTIKLKLNFQNTSADSIENLKSTINQNQSEINKLNSSLQEVGTMLSSFRTSLSRTNKKNTGEVNGYKQKVRQYAQRQTEILETIDKEKGKNDSLTQELGKYVVRTQLTDSLNKHLITEVVNNRANAFSEKLNLLRKLNGNTSADLYRNQYNINSYWFVIDSTKETLSRNKFMDSLSEVYSEIRLETDAMNTNTRDLEKAFEKFKSLKLQSEKTKINSPDDYAALNLKWNDLATDTADIAKKYIELSSSLEKTVNKYNSIIRNNVKDKIKNKDDKTTDFGAFPQLTSILGKREVIPQLQLFGSYLHQNSTKSFEGNIGLSFAPNGTSDTANLYSLFLANASKFLIHSNFVWSFAPVGTANHDTANLLGIRMEVNFAAKNLVLDTVKGVRSISSTLLYTKTGLEFGVLPKRLSLYANANTVTLLDKVAEFQESTGLKTKLFGYVDCGAKFYLDPTPNAKVDDKLFIYANINCIVNSGNVKKVTKTEDTVIPSIQIGIVKTLGRF